MDKYLLDTNVILRLVLKDNTEKVEEIVKLLKMAESGKASLYCDNISIFESAFVLMGDTYKVDKASCVQILQKILSLRVIDFSEIRELELALEIYLENNISLPDAFLLAKSKLSGMKFFSFDKRANKVYNIL